MSKSLSTTGNFTPAADLPVKKQQDALAQIHEAKSGICNKGGHYHVYHRAETRRGFTSVIIPKNGRDNISK